MLTDEQVKEAEIAIDKWWSMLDRNTKHRIYATISDSFYNDTVKDACDKTYESLNKIYRPIETT